jgi:hypothetical protein
MDGAETRVGWSLSYSQGAFTGRQSPPKQSLNGAPSRLGMASAGRPLAYLLGKAGGDSFVSRGLNVTQLSAVRARGRHGILYQMMTATGTELCQGWRVLSAFWTKCSCAKFTRISRRVI